MPTSFGGTRADVGGLCIGWGLGGGGVGVGIPLGGAGMDVGALLVGWVGEGAGMTVPHGGTASAVAGGGLQMFRELCLSWVMRNSFLLIRSRHTLCELTGAARIPPTPATSHVQAPLANLAFSPPPWLLQWCVAIPVRGDVSCPAPRLLQLQDEHVQLYQMYPEHDGSLQEKRFRGKDQAKGMEKKPEPRCASANCRLYTSNSVLTSATSICALILPSVSSCAQDRRLSIWVLEACSAETARTVCCSTSRRTEEMSRVSPCDRDRVRGRWESSRSRMASLSPKLARCGRGWFCFVLFEGRDLADPFPVLLTMVVPLSAGRPRVLGRSGKKSTRFGRHG